MLFFSFDHAGNGPSDQDVVISMIRNMVPTLHTSSTTGGLSCPHLKGPVVRMTGLQSTQRQIAILCQVGLLV
jgi:hypothetical protein